MNAPVRGVCVCVGVQCGGCAVCNKEGRAWNRAAERRSAQRQDPACENMRDMRSSLCIAVRGCSCGCWRECAGRAVARSRLHRLDGCFCGRFVAHPLRPDDLHAGPTGKPKEPRYSPASCNQRVALLLLEVLKPLRAALLALSGLRGRRLLRLRPKLLPLLLPLMQLRRRRR